MNIEIINEISNNLNIKNKQTEVVLQLLSEGNTIPFISRYRKEVTGNLDEEQIRKITEVYEYEINLLKRKEDVIRLIEEKEMLTSELKQKIMACKKLVEVEDLYRPFKEKKKTKASIAIKSGLEPLSKYLLTFPIVLDKDEVKKYINESFKNEEEVINGAFDIIKENITDNANYRKWIRMYTFNNGEVISKIKKDAKDESKTYEMYYDYSEQVRYIKPHRILAINRGENEKILNVLIKVDEERINNFLNEKVIKNLNSEVTQIFKEKISEVYKKSIKPSIEREIRSELKEKAETSSIEVFKKNLENLLLTSPIKNKVILGFDPAYRTGCKLAVISKESELLHIDKIYPHLPQNKWEESKNKLKELIKNFDIDLIAIGNGTASRESEELVSETIKEINDKVVEYIIVSEAGASVYSASPLAIKEFPNLHVEERSAASIGRRVQDALSELVKIDSKSIGVGLYQHDVNQKKLKESLDFIVEKCVNSVGVNINTASQHLLKYISGLTTPAINKIIDYREKKGKINSRKELKKLLSDKIFTQSIGFMRIIDGINILDSTEIHPESYDITLDLIKNLDLNLNSINTEQFNETLKNLNIEDYAKNYSINIFTLNQIIESLIKPNRDFREDFEKPLLRKDILKIDDLSEGMKLCGTVRNVVDFGVFIDIGLKNDALAHISKLTNKFIKHPTDILSVGEIVDCYVDKIDREKNKIGLTLIKP